ncbi:MAG: hypothetical protein A3C30_03505 [Candidatus Levybacteria bacterium RIFCSPHIGHO2_02_FULL_40_18]|nr:MAG: hypothetical protein A2869_00080 [Candidatus Levybacteria bacterium RIFCSPHIGHO2_01_FULL_40_58]OGH26151.1 MAG: hypothetical protein A3C30_03505 [Candidatus Levybacteria bacterium RIFCSPHIGHO2_02_FULL_40_18]OGH31395.1 MAG: hypothetical protein A3E43_03415 [Candidatus Levybacteria bacterium RIFCSPHIGHO2_12_FULL_40_31]OGH40034.1 MAG: hypothetical protein A2894_03820 [Candidatus Levybacteria bacterium RIFCSPLOWO2_01_FULL_40_64]OGH48999.1 MAG: hypothetical protein A3I54_00285 [Candidatus Lev
MANPELSERSSAPELTPQVEPRVQKHIVIVTWAIRGREPHLFYWRDHNSYNDDPYLTGDINSESEINEVARAEVADSLVFEGVNEKTAKAAIKGVEKSGVIVFPFLEDGEERLEWKKRRVPMVFVEIMPLLLQELSKGDSHSLHPAWVLRPNSKWNNSIERRIEKAFKQFAAHKQSTT